MEIRERIESCLNDLDARRRQMAEFGEKVRALMETLKSEGTTPSTLGEVLEVLTSVLKNYADIDVSCREMIRALHEIGQSQDRIEDGRRKIIGGVEKILGHLSQMETLAKRSLGKHAETAETAPAKPASGPKKILLIRLRSQDSDRPGASGKGPVRVEGSATGAADLREDLIAKLLADEDPEGPVH
ncbi:MAG TPA: hypothetical protein VNI57_13290 [Candidatus Saccharimonadales bacterium]|nr:hypothetical protein [Candidatus Saccharimonadales bacterium]